MRTPLARALGVGSIVGSLSMSAMVGFTFTGHAATVCVPTSDAPTLEVSSEPVAPGGGLLVTGAGWCHPTDGGSRVALKIDEGAYARLDTSLHLNTTIWAIVEADPQNGTFSTTVTLPDGTDLTSKPAFPEGTHTIRALSGSIKDGDTTRTVKSTEFVVGEYEPNGAAEPVSTDDLLPAAQDLVLGVWRKNRLLVSVAQGTEGAWVQPSLLTKDGSARRPWAAEWFRLDAAGRVLLPPADGDFEGDFTLVLQSGDQDTLHHVIGWSALSFAGGEAGQKPGSRTPGTPKPNAKSTPRGDSAPGSRSDAGPQTLRPPVVRAPLVAPPTVPPAVVSPPQVARSEAPSSPYSSWSEMPSEDELAASLEGDLLRIQLGYSAASEPTSQDVHVYVGTPEAQLPAGWTTTSAGAVELSLAQLSGGEYRFGLQDADGTVLGWASAVVPDTSVALEMNTANDVLKVAGTSSSGPLGERDLWLGALGVALVLGLGAGLGASRLTSSRPIAHPRGTAPTAGGEPTTDFNLSEGRNS